MIVAQRRWFFGLLVLVAGASGAALSDSWSLLSDVVDQTAQDPAVNTSAPAVNHEQSIPLLKKGRGASVNGCWSNKTASLFSHYIQGEGFAC